MGVNAAMLIDPNPYESSREPAPTLAERSATSLGIAQILDRTPVWCLGITAGPIRGSDTGNVSRDYYHAVFDDSTLNAVQVGAGLGVTQGFAAGIAIGCVVLLAVAISRRCSSRLERV